MSMNRVREMTDERKLVGPNRERRPRDPAQAAVQVGKMLTKQIPKDGKSKNERP